MAQAGLHAAIGNQMRQIIPYEKRLFPALIFGSMLPDIDIIVVAIASIFYPLNQAEEIFHRTFSHSFFTLIFVFLLFSILSEIKKRPVLKSIGKGIALGMLTHLLVDTLIWFRQIDLLWPLPLEPINLWRLFNIPQLVFQILLALEFFCFRWYAWFLISQHIQTPGNQIWFVKYLNKWKKWEDYLFLLFIILVFWSPPFFKILFGIAYIPSLIMALFSTYMSRNALELRPGSVN
jgi:membrane-bound metal-dependent hydrolase YbcI (DUF457 family)